MAEDRLTVNLAPEVVAVLEQLAGQNGTHWTEELRRAISDRWFFFQEVQAGKSIVLESENDPTDRTAVEFR